jgi:peptidoglycan hydrolase-like protein with peptidoglycan-binding domain
MSPDTDFAASARRSQERRTAATRRRRRRLRGRTLAIVAAISMTAVSGVALAAESGSSAQSTQAATLSVGSNGPAVKQLQRKLHVSATGYYGPQTKRAVKRFQRSHGLAADGVAGPATLRALGIRVTSASYSNGGTAPTAGSSTRIPPVLEKIAECESGGNPRAVSAGGRYRGKYQFDRATWQRWGGTGDPAKASEATQDRIALKLYKARGTSPWPNCA